MKTDTSRLFDEMLKDNEGTGDISDSKKIEQEINAKIKESMGKMQDAFDGKLKEAEEKINNIINERKNEENEETEHTGSIESNNLSTEEEE